MSLAVSKRDGDVIWAGTDDGLVHLTRNGGKDWVNITPRGLKPGIINSIDLSEFKEGKAYITVMRYKFMDMNPYIYKTEDFGNNWKLISNGIDGENNDYILGLLWSCRWGTVEENSDPLNTTTNLNYFIYIKT